MDSSKKSVETQNREIAVPIRSITWGQVSYNYGSCPICGGANHYVDGGTKCYCPQCGQKVIWVYQEKNYNQMQIKRYKIVYRLYNLEKIDFKIIEAINMFEAICIFHFYEMRQRVDVLEVYEVIDT